MLEETKQYWLRVFIVAIIMFLVSYLAFFMAIKHNLKKIQSPQAQIENIEKFFEKQYYDIDSYMVKKMENPFEPKIKPMMVNLVKELNEYRVIIDLSQFNFDENAIQVDIKGDELTIKGQVDKNVRGTEKIINFTQTYYLDEKIEEEGIKKERKGNKYIIAIPFQE